MRIRKLWCTVAGAVLAVAALAGPVAAQDEARVWHVQGIPGISIDVCVGSEEVYSNVRYTRWRHSMVPAGSKRIRAFLSDRRECRGRKIIDTNVLIEPGSHVTLVYSIVGRRPGIRTFSNEVSAPASDRAWLKLHHAAKAAPLDGWVLQTVKPAADGHGPTVSGLRAGQSSVPLDVPERTMFVTVQPSDPDRRHPTLGVGFNVVGGRIYQALVLGTDKTNYRLLYLWVVV
jgi:hypothetical protein